MSANMLQLNQDKTELIIFAPKHQVKHFSDIRFKFDGTVLSDVLKIARSLAMLCFVHIYKKFVLATVMNGQPV
jgi:hypothetical protein